MRAFQISQFGLEHLQPVDLPDAGARPWNGADSRACNLSELSRSVDGARPLRSETSDAAHSPLRWSRRSGRRRSRRDSFQARRSRDWTVPAELAGRCPFSQAKSRGALGRRYRWHACGLCCVAGNEASLTSLPISVTKKPQHLPCAALTAWNALFHARRSEAGRHGCDSRNRRSFDLRVAVCQVSRSAGAGHFQ